VQGKCMYLLLSSDSDFNLLGNLVSRAGFAARVVAQRSILVEFKIIFQLRQR